MRLRIFTLVTGVGLLTAAIAPYVYAVPPIGILRVWDTLPIIGPDPTETIVDPIGVSGMVDTVTSPLSNITAYENMRHSGGPCGMAYWNPATDNFCWFGWGGGLDRAIALAPTGVAEKVNASGGFPIRTFRAGDTWNVISGSRMSVHFQGTGSGVCKGTDPADMAEIRTYTGIAPFDVTVDPFTYDVWLTTTTSMVSRLDPATNDVTSWAIPGGGSPFDLVLDTTQKPMFAVQGGTGDRVLHLDPDTDTFTQWMIPGGGIGPPVAGGYVTRRGHDRGRLVRVRRNRVG